MNKTETLPGGGLLFTSKAYPVTTDSLLLADFAISNPASGELRAGSSVCDLGSGNGVLLLSLVDAGLYGRAVGVEQSEEGTGLLRCAMDVDELINVESVCADFRDYSSPLQFDMVITNPPYFTEGELPATEERMLARHQVNATLAELCATAARLLKDGGRLMLCYPPTKLESLFAALRQSGLAPKVLQLVRGEEDAEPWLLLLEARKGGGEGLRILPDRQPTERAATLRSRG